MLTATEKQTLIANLKKYEGNVEHMYLDTAGNVTVGIGHLLKTVQDAQKLPFVDAGKKKATAEQIKADFDAVKKQPKKQYASKYKPFTKLHLEAKDILAGVNKHIDTFYRELGIKYPGFTTFPKEAQIALLDMGFNLGANGVKNKFPKMSAAVMKKDWAVAAKESHRAHPIAELRNTYVKNLFEKAAKSVGKK